MTTGNPATDPHPDLLHRIGAELPAMSKKQRLVAEFLLGDREHALFWSANRIARELQVSQSTVIRLAIDLGFGGFPELQAALRTARAPTMSMLQRLDQGRARTKPDQNPDEIHLAVWSQQMANMQETLQGLTSQALNDSVNLISRARNVYVFGAGGAAALAIYFTYNLSLIRPGVYSVADNVAGHFEKLMSAGPEDVLVSLGFPRYSYPTVEITSMAAARGAKVVAITDGFTSPLVPFATVLLPAAVQSIGFQYFYSGVLTILDSLLTIVGLRNETETRTQLAAWEEVARRYGIYHLQESEPVWEQNRLAARPERKRRKHTISDH